MPEEPIPLWIPKSEPLPTVLSERHQAEIEASRKLYAECRFVEAAKVVETVLLDEPDNLYLLQCYALALFRTDALGPSFDAYKRLVSLLDKRKEPGTIGLDPWFSEAYWNYGILLMDRGEWESAAFEISRALAISFSLNERRPAVLYAYSFLAKAYFQMDRFELAKYYADAALQINPHNEFAKYYVEKIHNKNP